MVFKPNTPDWTKRKGGLTYSIHVYTRLKIRLASLQWNPVNTFTNRACHSVRNNRVSVLNGHSQKKRHGHMFYRFEEESKHFHEKTLSFFLTITVSGSSYKKPAIFYHSI